MPQNANAATVAVTPAKVQSPLLLDNFQNVNITGTPNVTTLGIAASVALKTTPARVGRASVIVAGSAAGSVNDCATTAAAGTANALAVLPNTVGNYAIDAYTATGLVVVPGTGMTVAVTWE
ncbi:MAG: hypothetical protein V4447_10675 [Pseudomonadota bacterium]